MELNSDKTEKIRIALVDDHRWIREFLVNNINLSMDCSVVFSGENGQELLDYLKYCGRLPDLCILDINMPVLNGYDTQLAINKFWPDMKTLVMSIYEDEDCVVQMLKNGANGFVSKNWGLVKLEEAIRSIHKHGCYPVTESQDNLMNNTKGIPTFTDREKEYLFLTCDGRDTEHIAIKMGVSARTVEHYRDAVYHKTKVNNKADLILFVHRTGVVVMK